MQKKQLNYKKYFSIALILFVSGLLSCTAGQKISSVSSLGKDDVLLVGKVILEPPLNPSEYYKKINTVQGKAGCIYLYCSNKLTQIDNLEIGFKEVTNSIEAENSQTFFVKFKNQPLYFYYTFIMMGLDSEYQPMYVYLPAGWVANIQPGDKAIYIGTIKYTRDEFFRITKVEIINEFDSVSKEYYQKYGTAIPLKQSLLKSM
ncbi:MAG: hypothetical protein WBK20_15605 [Spirochaetota bacterium]